ncbi:MAG: GerMN domain-containing protein [Bacilli bacterium]
MLKRAAFRRIILASLALVILLIIYFFPDKESYINESLSYVEKIEMPIFLIDKMNYVARTTIVKKNEIKTDVIKEIIDALTIEGTKSSYIPNGFSAIIPKNTKLLSMDLKEGLLKLNFSKEFLDVSKEFENKLIEALIFSLTEMGEVEKIMIFIEDKQLTKLPHSNKELPNTLDKTYGINKIYNIETLKDTSKTTIYYLSKNNDFYYYVPVTEVSNEHIERVEIIIKNLKTTPIYHTNLISYLTASANLLSYQLLENSISLSFNNKILANIEEKDILEEVKYSISLSLRDTYGINTVIFNVDNEKIDTAHV